MTATETDLATLLEQMKAQVATLTARLAQLESASEASHTTPTPNPHPQPRAAEGSAPGITEEELLAISAALGAFLGVRVHIKQIRLLSSLAWAQQGRVSIQASHRLHT